MEVDEHPSDISLLDLPLEIHFMILSSIAAAHYKGLVDEYLKEIEYFNKSGEFYSPQRLILSLLSGAARPTLICLVCRRFNEIIEEFGRRIKNNTIKYFIMQHRIGYGSILSQVHIKKLSLKEVDIGNSNFYEIDNCDQLYLNERLSIKRSLEAAEVLNNPTIINEKRSELLIKTLFTWRPVAAFTNEILLSKDIKFSIVEKAQLAADGHLFFLILSSGYFAFSIPQVIKFGENKKFNILAKNKAGSTFTTEVIQKFINSGKGFHRCSEITTSINNLNSLNNKPIFRNNTISTGHGYFKILYNNPAADFIEEAFLQIIRNWPDHHTYITWYNSEELFSHAAENYLPRGGLTGFFAKLKNKDNKSPYNQSILYHILEFMAQIFN